MASLRLALGTVAACGVLYPALLLGFAQAAAPGRAQGSLIYDPRGRVIGSRLIAQAFEQPAYLWPRPSGVAYDAARSGGSNLAASNPALRQRGIDRAARLAGAAAAPIPGARRNRSGSRSAVPRARVERILRAAASAGGPWTEPLVNVLEVNLALDGSVPASLPPR